jgi:ATP-dependent Clp protease ATP-binding subunit ClpC
MNEPLTERFSRVMGLAYEEASRLHHEYLGTEHILLGIVRESTGPADEALRSFGVTLELVRSDVERIVGIGPETGSPDELGVSPRAKRVLGFALEEATRCRTPLIVDPEHLLLGITREDQGIAAQVLVNLGAAPAVVRERVMGLLDRGDSGKP